jgi:Protein of unknown function (DUF3040)
MTAVRAVRARRGRSPSGNRPAEHRHRRNGCAMTRYEQEQLAGIEAGLTKDDPTLATAFRQLGGRPVRPGTTSGRRLGLAAIAAGMVSLLFVVLTVAFTMRWMVVAAAAALAVQAGLLVGMRRVAQPPPARGPHDRCRLG